MVAGLAPQLLILACLTDVTPLLGFCKQDSADLGPDTMMGSGSLAEVCPWGGQVQGSVRNHLPTMALLPQGL